MANDSIEIYRNVNHSPPFFLHSNKRLESSRVISSPIHQTHTTFEENLNIVVWCGRKYSIVRRCALELFHPFWLQGVKTSLDVFPAAQIQVIPRQNMKLTFLSSSAMYLLLLISSQSFRTKSRQFNIELSFRFSFDFLLLFSSSLFPLSR